MNIWFSSDHHFNHNRIIELCNRPFTSLADMNETMISRWNSVVKDKDEVYYLGDLVLGNWRVAESFINRLNGKIRFIKGNHDENWFSGLDQHQRLSPIHELKINKQLIVLSHYPLRGWNKSFHGSLHLFGHEHGNIPPLGKSFDVGVDCHLFYPVSLEEVIEKMETL